MSSSTADKIVKAGITVIIAHVIFKLMGLIQNIILPWYFKDKVAALDAFVIAFEGIILMIFLIGEESIGPAFLPVFSEEKNKGSEKKAWQFANGLLSIHTVLILLISLFIIIKSEFVVKCINVFSGNGYQCEGPKNVFIKELLQYMGLGLVGLSLGSTTYMILNGFKRFFWAAFGDTLTKAAIIIAVLFLYKRETAEIYHSSAVLALGIGCAVGGFAKLAGHLWGLRDKLPYMFSTKPVIQSPAFKKFCILVAPLLAGIVFSKAREFINNILILNNIEIDGIISARSWGSKLYKTVGWFIPYGIAIAMFPYFCDMIDKDNKRELGHFLTDSSQILLLFFFPITAGGAILSYPMISLLFGHGNTEWIGWASAANVCYMLVLPFYSLEYFFLQGFFADRRMVTPIVLGIVCSSISVGISFFVVIVLQVHIAYSPAYAVAAVALGYTFSRALKIVLFIHFFKKNIPVFTSGRSAVFFIKLFIITAAVSAAAFFAKQGFFLISGPLWSETRKLLLAQILISTIAGGAAFLVCVYILKVREFKTAVSWALQKIRRSRNQTDDSRQDPASIREEQHDGS